MYRYSCHYCNSFVLLYYFFGNLPYTADCETRAIWCFKSNRVKKNIFKQNILLELGIIYVVAVPLGVGIGNGIARGVMKLSGDEKQIIYLYGERVRFGVIVPVIQIIIGLLLLAVAISCVGLVACHSIYKKSIIEVISNEVDPNVHRSSKFLRIDKSSSKLRTFGFCL